MCRADGGDTPTICRTKKVQARKPHRCAECRRTIEPGETYEYTFMVFEGSGDSYRVCAQCLVACRWLARNCGGYLFHEVREEIEEHAVEYPALGEPLRALAAAMRAGWRGSDGVLMAPLPLPPPITVEASSHG